MHEGQLTIGCWHEEEGRTALAQFLRDKEVACKPVTGSEWQCTAQNRDIADWLVRNGYALDQPKSSGGKYNPAEQDARAHERGVWSFTWVEMNLRR
jgi:endonuclease YncB( thermonuclease family)